MKHKYWAYLHQSGHIHVKRYWGGVSGHGALKDAYDSPFVVEVVDPFEAETHEEAVRIASAELRLAPASPQTAADVQARRLDAEVRGHDRDENSAARQEANL